MSAEILQFLVQGVRLAKLCSEAQLARCAGVHPRR
jgi:hypothetical protein